ncbi:hypothetical protein CLU79DRAFT_839621 [Phycomyces nitens]|nr:hypothetical protein CLU79DRAFT_839621 [Phycomyces nitens]
MPTTQWPIEDGSQPSVLNNESLHCLGLLGYSVEEFLSSHLRWSRLVMMRSVGSDIRLSLSHQLSGIPVDSRTWMWFGCAGSVASGIGWATEFLRSHSRRSRLVMMRSVEHGCDSVVLVSVASGIGWATGRFSAGESLHGLLGYSIEVNIFQWPALRRQEFLSSHSRRSRLVMMRSVGSDIRLSLSHQLSGIPVDSRTWM